MTEVAYRYVNYTRCEFVDLDDLAGHGANADVALLCAPALAYLILPGDEGDGYQGRWATEQVEIDRRSGSPRHGMKRVACTQDVQIVPGTRHSFDDMWNNHGFINVTPGLLSSMRRFCARRGLPAVGEWSPSPHDVAVDTTGWGTTRSTPEALSATCSCGWAPQPIRGDDRVVAIEMAMSDHVNGGALSVVRDEQGKTMRRTP